jgi:hypothetical protein
MHTLTVRTKKQKLIQPESRLKQIKKLGEALSRPDLLAKAGIAMLVGRQC